MCVTHLSFEKQGNSAQKKSAGNEKASKKVQMCSEPAHFISHPAFFKLLCVQVGKTWRMSES
jgi:hypothetical protein